MGIFDIFKPEEKYKGFTLSRDVDPALQKQLIDRGRGSEVNSLTPEAVTKSQLSNQTANTTPMMISGGKNTLAPVQETSFLKEFGKINQPANFNKEVIEPVSNAVFSNKGVQQGLEKTVGWATKVDDTLQGRVLNDQGTPVLVSDLPIAQQAVGYAMHGLNRVGLGVLGTAESTLNGMKWLGVDEAKPMADKLKDWQSVATTADGGFLDSLMSGAGSAATFFVPAIGISKGASLIGNLSPRVLQLLGGSKTLANVGMTAFEALSEAGDTYNSALESGQSEESADSAATKTFWANAALIGVTNYISYFNNFKQPTNKILAGLKNIITGMGGEGLQEFGQQVIQNLSQGKTEENVFDGALEAGAIGAILGGVFGMSDFDAIGVMPIDDKAAGGGDDKAVAVPESVIRVENGKETKYFETANEAQSYVSSNNISDTAVITSLDRDNIVGIISKDNLTSFPFANGVSSDQKKIDSTIEEIKLKTGVSQSEAVSVFNAVKDLMDRERIQRNGADDIFKEAVERAKIESGQAPDIIQEAVKMAENSVTMTAAQEEASISKQMQEQAKFAQEQYVTTEEATASSKSFPFIQELNVPVVAKKQIMTASGKQALGKYSKGMIEFIENPKASTVPHEAVHAYMDIMLDKKGKQVIISEAKRRFAGKVAAAKKSGSYKGVNVKGLTDDAIAEEILAEDMINYVKTGQAPSNKLKVFYDWFIEQIKNLLGKGNIDIIDKFYKEVQSVPTVAARELARTRMARASLNMEAIQAEYLQNPDALTTKFLENIDVKNRETASYEFLKNLLKSKSLPLKESERVLIDSILDEQFKDEKKINMEDFRNAVKTELLPLQVIKSETYADYGAENVDKSDYDSETHIYNSPFNHGYTGHFSGDFRNLVRREELEVKQIPTTEKWAVIKKGVELNEGNIAENVLHVAKSEELANEWIGRRAASDFSAKQSTGWVDIGSNGLFGHARVWDNNSDTTRYVAEIQSDSFQNPERLDGVDKKIRSLAAELVAGDESIQFNENNVRRSQERIDGYTALIKFLEEGGAEKEGLLDNPYALDRSVAGEKKAGTLYDIYNIPNFAIDTLNEYVSKGLNDLYVREVIEYSKVKIKSAKIDLEGSDNRLFDVKARVAKEKVRINAELENLKPTAEETAFLNYKNVWHERIVREEIRQAAMDGKTKLRFPTPYTIAKIEGYLSETGQIPEGTVVGDTFDYGGESYIVLKEDQQMGEDGAMVAPEKDVRGTWDYETLRSEDENNLKDEISFELRDAESSEDFNQKIDDSYFISNFLSEEEIQKIKDDYAVNEDINTNIIDDLIDKAITAEIDSRYTDASSYADYWNDSSGDEGTFATTEGQVIILDDNSNTETMTYGGKDNAEKEGFNYETDLDSKEQQTVARFYDKQVNRYLAKLRKQNLRTVTDDAGFDWLETDIMPEDKAAVEAFQTPANRQKPIMKTGRQVADYVEEVQQGKEGDSEPLSSYMRGVIAGQSYSLEAVKIKDLLKQDPDLREYVKAGEQRYPEGVEYPENIDLPIVVGTWGDNVGVVLDGYNRTLTKYQAGEEMIEAWVSNDQKVLPEEDKIKMVEFIDYARLAKDENIGLEIEARYIAEGLSINPDVSNKVLANRFEAKLSTEPKYQEVSEIFREGEKRFVDNTDLVARERFNIPLLEKLSFGGSDRDVYNLGDNVLKVAKSARGLAQNRLEGEPYAPVPELIERGENYVVTVFAEKPNEKTKKLVKRLQKHKSYYNNINTIAVDMINKTANEYYEEGDEDMGSLVQDLNNYNVMHGDVTAIRNWGTIDGEPVLIDAGTLDASIIKDYEGSTNLSDSDFRGVYRRSKAAKLKYGDLDEKTKYQELDERTNELMMRREDLQRERENFEINEEDRIQTARETSLEFSNTEKETGYQNFKKLAKRRSWVLDSDTDDMALKNRLPALNIDRELFSYGEMSNNDLLEEFKDRYYQEEKLESIAMEVTPIEQAIKNQKIAQRVVKSATVRTKIPTIKDETSLNRALNIANGIERPITITKKASQLLRNRLRDMARAAKTGAAYGRAEMKADLSLAFATKLDDLKSIRKAIVEFAQELPVAERGQMLTAVANAKTELDMAKAFARIDAALEASDNKAELQKMAKMAKKVKKAMKTGKGIAIDYQKKIADILKDYNLSKPSAATIEKLNSLSDYIESHPEANIPDHLVKRLNILKKLDAKNIGNDVLSDINDLLLRLWNLGELKLAMKGKYDKRFIKNSVDKLLTTTVNVDKKSIGGLSWLHAARVADILDGTRRYKGYNVALQKKISFSVAKAQQGSEQIVKEAMTSISSLKNEFTKEEQAIMAFQMAKDQKLYSQAQAIIGAYAGEYGWKKESDLQVTPEMQHAINVLRGTFAKTVDYLAAVYEEIENKPFVKGENYFPNKYDKEFDKNVDLDVPTIGEMQNYQGKQINKGFTIARMPNVKKVLRTDIFNVFAEAVGEQQYYMSVQPVLNEIASIVKQPAYQERVGKVGMQWWDRYLKGVANKGRSLNRGIFDSFLREKRLNISKAVLGFKVTSALLQPTAIIDAYAYVYLNHGALAANELLMKLAGTLLIPSYSKGIVSKSLALQLRKGDAGEQILQEIGMDKTGSKVGKALTKAGMWALRGLDIKTASAVQRTMFNHFRRAGMDVATAQREADFVMNLTQGSSEIGDVPLVLMEGEAYRTLLTFQTFVLNRWGLITHDIIKSGIMKGSDVPRKIKGLIALFLISLAGGVESILRKTTSEAISGNKYPEKFNFLQQSLLTIPETIPVVGSILTSVLEYGQGASIPLSRLAENIIKGATGIVNPTGETKAQQEISRTKSALKLGEAIGTYKGVTGTAQLFDLIGRMLVPTNTPTKSAGGTKNNLQQPALPKLPELPKPPKLPKPPLR